MTNLCIPHAQDLVRGGDGCTVCRLERELAEAKRCGLAQGAEVQALQDGKANLMRELADMTAEANAWRSSARDSGEEARKYKRELAEARGLLNRWVYWHDNANCTSAPPDLLGASRNAALASDQPRAYHETHEPPHCPTCGCAADQPCVQCSGSGRLWMPDRNGEAMEVQCENCNATGRVTRTDQPGATK